MKWRAENGTFPCEPSPRKDDRLKLPVASLSSSKENTRYVGITCDPSFTA